MTQTAEQTAREVAAENKIAGSFRRVLDSHYDNAPAIEIMAGLVVYEDEPDCVVSCGNETGRWLAA